MDPELAVFLQRWQLRHDGLPDAAFRSGKNAPAEVQHRARIKPGRGNHLRRAPVHPTSRVERNEMHKQLDCLLKPLSLSSTGSWQAKPGTHAGYRVRIRR